MCYIMYFWNVASTYDVYKKTRLCLCVHQDNDNDVKVRLWNARYVSLSDFTSFPFPYRVKTTQLSAFPQFNS